MKLIPADPDAALVDTERIRSVFEQAPLTLGVTIINAILTAVVFAPVFDHRLLFIWVTSIVAVSGARWVVRRIFFRRHLEGARSLPWPALSVLGSLATG